MGPTKRNCSQISAHFFLVVSMNAVIQADVRFSLSVVLINNSFFLFVNSAAHWDYSRCLFNTYHEQFFKFIGPIRPRCLAGLPFTLRQLRSLRLSPIPRWQ